MTAGLEFIPENGGGAGIRFRERAKNPLRSEKARAEMKAELERDDGAGD